MNMCNYLCERIEGVTKTKPSAGTVEGTIYSKYYFCSRCRKYIPREFPHINTKKKTYMCCGCKLRTQSSTRNRLKYYDPVRY